MKYREAPFFFECSGESLLGVLTVPEQPARVAVVIVVGGPQYRVGSHRQFLLLARYLAGHGFACLRFDYRGMGDSGGARIGFEDVGPDIGAALDALKVELPQVSKVVIWGLCDGASAASLFAHQDPRVCGLVLFNPWVRTDAIEAETRLKHYYMRRVLGTAFWRKLVSGEVQLGDSLRSLIVNLRRVFARPSQDATAVDRPASQLPDRVGAALLACGIPVLIVLSEFDSVATEFRQLASRPGALAKFVNDRLPAEVVIPADHTFSCSKWRGLAADATLQWLRTQFSEADGRPTAAVPGARGV